MAKRGHKERKSKEERATDVCLFFFLQFGNKTNIEIINKIVVKNFYIFVRVRSFLNLWLGPILYAKLRTICDAVFSASRTVNITWQQCLFLRLKRINHLERRRNNITQTWKEKKEVNFFLPFFPVSAQIRANMNKVQGCGPHTKKAFVCVLSGGEHWKFCFLFLRKNWPKFRFLGSAAKDRFTRNKDFLSYCLRLIFLARLGSIHHIPHGTWAKKERKNRENDHESMSGSQSWKMEQYASMERA